jgi:hypothetical protein
MTPPGPAFTSRRASRLSHLLSSIARIGQLTRPRAFRRGGRTRGCRGIRAFRDRRCRRHDARRKTKAGLGKSPARPLHAWGGHADPAAAFDGWPGVPPPPEFGRRAPGWPMRPRSLTAVATRAYNRRSGRAIGETGDWSMCRAARRGRGGPQRAARPPPAETVRPEPRHQASECPPSRSTPRRPELVRQSAGMEAAVE